MSNSVILVNSNLVARKLNTLRAQLNLKIRICYIPWFKDFPTPEVTKLKDLGIDVKNSFELLYDKKQPAIIALEKAVKFSDVVYIATDGISSDYIAYIYRNIIKEKSPTKTVKRLRLSGLTHDRFLYSINDAQEDDFSETAYNKELTLRALDRLTSFYAVDKKLSDTTSFYFPGLYIYYIMNYMQNKAAGYTVSLTTNDQLFKTFSTEEAADIFVKEFDPKKITKRTEAFTHHHAFEDSHFMRSRYLLSKYSPTDLVDGLWLLYHKGFITNPLFETPLFESELTKVQTVLERYGIQAARLSIKDRNGYFVTDPTLEVEDIVDLPPYYIDIYRYIRRVTLAHFAQSFKGTITHFYYGDPSISTNYLGHVYQSSNKGGYVSLLSTLDPFTFLQDTKKHKVLQVRKNVVNAYDVISFFGYRGFHALKILKEYNYIDIDSSFNISIRSNATLVSHILKQRYPDMLTSSFLHNMMLQHSNVSDIHSRIDFLSYYSLYMKKPVDNVRLPDCPICKNPLSIVINKVPFFVCRTSCGRSFDVDFRNNELLPIIKDTEPLGGYDD